MSDSITGFSAWKKYSQPAAGEEPTVPNGWTNFANPIGAATSQNDTEDPNTTINKTIWYALRGHTANGVTIPYVGQQLSLNTAGDIIWKGIATATGSLLGAAITSDSGGNLYLAMGFRGAVTIQGQTVDTGNVNSGTEFFLAKFSPSGSLIFLKKYGSPNGHITVSCIAADSSGNIAVGGRYSFTGNFGGDTFQSISDSLDAFVAKYNSVGNHVWSDAFGSPIAGSTDIVNSIGFNSSGELVAAGYISVSSGNATITIGGTPHTFWGSGQQLFLTKYDVSGSAGRGVTVWFSPILTLGPELAPIIAVNRAIDPYSGLQDTIILHVSGGFGGTLVTIGGDIAGVGGTPYQGKAILAKFRNDTGLPITSAALTGAYVIPKAIAIDSNGDVLVTGPMYYDGATYTVIPDFGTGPIANASWYGNAYVAKCSGSDFHCLWAAWASSSGHVPLTNSSEYFAGLMVDGANNVYLCGRFMQYLNFYDANNYTTIRKTLSTSGAGGVDETTDVCVAKYLGSNGTLATATGGYWAYKYGVDSVNDSTYGVANSLGAPVVSGPINIGTAVCALVKVNP